MTKAAVPIVVSEPEASRFWSLVDQSGECWLWPLSTQSQGYGQFTVGHRSRLAHRVSWTIAFGPIPAGSEVCHNCPGGDNPRCVRPSHLFLGSHTINMRDMQSKGRHGASTHPECLARGEANGKSKLTAADVLSIRARLGHVTHINLAREFGVSPGTIGFIASGQTWRHLLHESAPAVPR